jgi:hypothetical protein
VLGALLALGLILFATKAQRLIGVIQTWLLYGLTLVPIFLFNRQHPQALLRRLYEVSYIRSRVPFREIASEFVRRYLEDQSLYALLLTGDHHPRHHVQGSGGAILLATFILAMIGLLLVFTRGWRDPWWRFVLYGLAVSIVPGAITNWPFHQLRLMSYAVFLLLLTVPALEWLLAPGPPTRSAGNTSHEAIGGQRSQGPIGTTGNTGVSRPSRLAILVLLLAATILQAIHYQTVFRREGAKREYEFDVPYKALYDATVARPERPIYLENGMWGPAYMDAFWYATVEGRPLSEFVRLPNGAKPSRGAIVISSNSDCRNCEVLRKSGVYLLYRAK